jgi:parallel beta-helix repeat protein
MTGEMPTRRHRYARMVLELIAAALVGFIPALAEAGPIGCGAILTGNNVYTLTADVLDCAGPGPAITIDGRATLMLNGYTVSCQHKIELEQDPDEPDRPFPHTVTTTPGSIGIALTGVGAQLLGGGFYTESANEEPENRVLGCDNNVVVEGNGKHLVRGVHSIQSGESAFLVLSNGNALVGNVVRQEFIDHPGLGFDPRPARCETSGYVVEGHRNAFETNVSADCIDNGFVIHGSKNRFNDNTARDNDGYGFDIDGSENDLHGNAALKNLTGGFIVGESVQRNTLDHNLSSQNGDGEPADGFEILGDRNTLTFNKADNNGRYGISLYGEGNVISGNSASRSEETDLTDWTKSCGSNRWSTNIFETRNQDCIK